MLVLHTFQPLAVGLFFSLQSPPWCTSATLCACFRCPAGQRRGYIINNKTQRRKNKAHAQDFFCYLHVHNPVFYVMQHTAMYFISRSFGHIAHFSYFCGVWGVPRIFQPLKVCFMKKIEINSQAFLGQFALETSSFVSAYLAMVRDFPNVRWNFEAHSSGKFRIFAFFDCGADEDEKRGACGRRLAELLPQSVVRSIFYSSELTGTPFYCLRAQLDF